MAQATLTKRLQRLNRVTEQENWIIAHGGSLAGYIVVYGAASNPYHSGNGGEAIYNADLNELLRLKRLAQTA